MKSPESKPTGTALDARVPSKVSGGSFRQASAIASLLNGQGDLRFRQFVSIAPPVRSERKSIQIYCFPNVACKSTRPPRSRELHTRSDRADDSIGLAGTTRGHRMSRTTRGTRDSDQDEWRQHECCNSAPGKSLTTHHYRRHQGGHEAVTGEQFPVRLCWFSVKWRVGVPR